LAYQPRYRISQVALAAAERLGAARAVVELLPLPLEQVRSLRRRTLIRVAHNSTWIENRALVLEQAAAAIESKATPSGSTISVRGLVRQQRGCRVRSKPASVHVTPSCSTIHSSSYPRTCAASSPGLAASIDQHFGAAEVSERFKVTSRSAREWLKKWREAGFH
jgi:hypothetical protein